MTSFRITHLLRRFVRNENGGTLVELAVLIPALAVALAAVTEVGRLFQNYNTLSKATRTAARYLSNHPFNSTEQAKAKNLVVCGKLTACAANDRLVKGIETSHICIESSGAPTIETVTVRIPRTAGDCGAPLVHQPIFDIGALLHNSFSLAKPMSPSTTMWHRLD